MTKVTTSKSPKYLKQYSDPLIGPDGYMVPPPRRQLEFKVSQMNIDRIMSSLEQEKPS